MLFSLSSQKNFFLKGLSEFLWIAIVRTAGKKEALALGFRLMVFQKNKGIFRCRREQCAQTKRIINSIKEISGSRVSIKTLKTSGTMKTLKEKL